MQPLLPLLAHHDAINQILVQEHLMALSNQPPIHSISRFSIVTGVADEYPCHPYLPPNGVTTVTSATYAAKLSQ
jgi:hypothetical protein